MKIAKIIPNDIANGKDICVSLFVQGCPLHCSGCFNPETWDFDGGTEINLGELIEYLVNLINKNGVQRNFSLLGGEPLASQNRVDVATIVEAIKKVYPNIKIWLWTGYTIETLKDTQDSYINYLLNTVDVVVDGPYIEAERDLSLPHAGSRNQRVIDVKKTIANKKIIQVKTKEERSYVN